MTLFTNKKKKVQQIGLIGEKIYENIKNVLNDCCCIK